MTNAVVDRVDFTGANLKGVKVGRASETLSVPPYACTIRPSGPLMAPWLSGRTSHESLTFIAQLTATFSSKHACQSGCHPIHGSAVVRAPWCPRPHPRAPCPPPCVPCSSLTRW